VRAMQTPLGRTVLIIGVGLFFLLIVSTNAVLIALTLFLVRRSRVPRLPPPEGIYTCAGGMSGKRLVTVDRL
jgi:hypothetical protein